MDAMVLAFGFDAAELKGLKAACARKSVRLRRVLPEEYGQSIGALCGAGRRREDAASGGALPGPMLVFAHFRDRQLDMFLSELQTARLGRSALKAMLTPTNAQWSPAALYAELSREKSQTQGEPEP